MSKTITIAIDKDFDEMLAELGKKNHRSKKNQNELLILEAWQAQCQPAEIIQSNPTETQPAPAGAGEAPHE